MHSRTALRLILAGGLALAWLGAGHARAEGLAIKDGLWETTMKNPMTGERVSRECLKGTTLDPGSMLEGQDDCTMTEQNIDGNTLTFTMTCTESSATVEGRMFVDGDQGGGEMHMNFDVDGRKMDMTLTWDAVRVGDC